MEKLRNRYVCSRKLCTMSARRSLREARYSTSWNSTSAATTDSISLFSIWSPISTSIRSNVSISSAVIRSAARPAASSSRADRISNTWVISFNDILATYVPRRGTITTKPSSSSLRIASRIGVRLTPSSSARGISIRRSPGFNTPS